MFEVVENGKRKHFENAADNKLKPVSFLCDPAKNTECSASVNGVCTSKFCDFTVKIECAKLDKSGAPIQVVQ